MCRSYHSFLFMVLFIVFMLIGCSGQQVDSGESNEEENSQSAEANGEEPAEPITLKFMYQGGFGPFDEVVKEQVEEKFPHITLEHLEYDSPNMESLEEAVAARNFPDLVLHNNEGGIRNFQELGMDVDLIDLVDQTNFDLSRIRSDLLDSVPGYKQTGELYGMPFFALSYALYYNKEIFDLFGVNYPQDHMTWNEVIDLAQELTSEREGIQYRGLYIAYEAHPSNQLQALSVDPETDEVMYLEDERWYEFFEVLERLFSIPGNYPNGVDDLWSQPGPFLEGNVAMVAGSHFTDVMAQRAEESGMQWDMVTYPTFESRPNTNGWGLGPTLGISATSEHPEEAMKVIDYMTSVEFQKTLSRRATITPLDSQEVIDEFGLNWSNLEDKNTAALFALEYPAPNLPRVHEEEYPLENMPSLVDAIEDLLSGEKDINTILREMQEQGEAAVKNARGMN